MGVLVTKEAHCLEQLCRDRNAGLLSGDLVVVLSNHPDLEPLARMHDLPFHWIGSKDKPAHEDFLVAKLAEYRVDLVVLARYMQILTPRVIERYPFRIINIHPSLLPYHPGSNAYKQAWEEGVRVSGCTAHFVTEQLDAGPGDPAGRLPHPRRARTRWTTCGRRGRRWKAASSRTPCSST